MVDEFVETTQNTNKTQLLASNYGTFWSSCLWEIHTLKWTLYSAHQCDKLRLNVKCHNWSWRAWGHFWLSNVVRGQKVKTLLSSHDHQKSWCIYAPFGVKLFFNAQIDLWLSNRLANVNHLNFLCQNFSSVFCSRQNLIGTFGKSSLMWHRNAGFEKGNQFGVSEFWGGCWIFVCMHVLVWGTESAIFDAKSCVGGIFVSAPARMMWTIPWEYYPVQSNLALWKGVLEP
jgi:hypothetical protein